MSLDTLFALVSFAFVMSISPGPGNFLLLASGANFGIAKSLPLMFGVSAGVALMLVIVSIGVGELMNHYPVLTLTMKVMCAVYIAYLSFSLWRVNGTAMGASSALAEPMSFQQALLLQCLNPKAWTASVLVSVSFLPSSGDSTAHVLLLLVFMSVNFPSISVWALCGVWLRRYLLQKTRLLYFNRILAVLLFISMSIMLGSA